MPEFLLPERPAAGGTRPVAAWRIKLPKMRQFALQSTRPELVYTRSMPPLRVARYLNIDRRAARQTAKPADHRRRGRRISARSAAADVRTFLQLSPVRSARKLIGISAFIGRTPPPPPVAIPEMPSCRCVVVNDS